MAVITNTIKASDLAFAQDVELNRMYDQEVQEFITLLSINEPQVQTAGTAIYQYSITGTPVAATTEGDEIPLSKYTETKGDPYIVTIRNYRKLTTQKAIQNSGYEHAVNRTDRELMKDLRIATVQQLFSALDADGVTTATGADFKKALVNANSALVTAMEQAGDTIRMPVFFVNRQDYADYVGANDVHNDGSGNVFGMTYIQNLAGINGIVMQTSRVESGTIFATDTQNLHLYVPDYGATANGGLEYQISDLGVISTHHAPSYERAGVQTFVNAGLMVIPEFVNYICKATIGATGATGGTN